MLDQECDEVGRSLCSREHLKGLKDLRRDVRRQSIPTLIEDARAVRMAQRLLNPAMNDVLAEPRGPSRRARLGDLLRRAYLARRMIGIYVDELERRRDGQTD